MPLTPDDVQNKRFTVVRFGKSGYDEEEVDTFLDEIEAEMRQLLAESNSLQVAAKAAAAAPPLPAPPSAPPPPAPAPAPIASPPKTAEEHSETALRTLLLAQRTADDAIAQAKEEAEQMVSTARVKAAALERDAQTEHTAKTADLARQRAAAEAEIAELREFERDYRFRLRAYLEGQLSDLETSANSASPTLNAALTRSSNPAPVVPSLAPPTVNPPPVRSVTPPLPPSASSSAGPFSTAPAPAVPASPFTAQPPTTPTPPARSSFAPPRVQPASFDTDVDAASDVPSGPPAQADDDDTDDTGH
jgi:DivIVA domain-containing protein